MNEHGTSLFYFKMYFPLRSVTLRENFSRDLGIKEPFWEASVEVSDFENTPSKEKICRLKKTLANIILKLWSQRKYLHFILHTSCLHFIGVDYYPALIMIWCDMFTSISLLTVRVGSILHGFCTAHVRCQSAYHRNDYKYYFYEIHTSISTFLGNRFSVKRKKN